MTFRIVVADAMVLVGRTARDYLIYAYLDGLIELRYSEQILHEVRRAEAKRNTKNRWPEPDALAQRVFDVLHNNVPGALDSYTQEDEQAFAHLQLRDPNDLHVLALARAVSADIICSDDATGFPDEALALIGATRLTLDATLSAMIDQQPDAMRKIHHTVVAKNPRLDDTSTLVALAKRAPGAASRLENLLGG